MHELPALPLEALADPIANALRTSHRHFALAAGKALKYPRLVAPFSAVTENSPEALRDLLSLMEPGESTNVILPEPPAPLPDAQIEGPAGVPQMLFPTGSPLDMADDPALFPLTCADAPAMLDLTSVAFPGFFRPRTCEMGNYYGIWDAGKLVAMAGERFILHPFREISGVCTHPGHRGRGHIPRLMYQLLRDHRRAGHTSILHVAANNARAIDIYQRMGFITLREFPICRITKP